MATIVLRMILKDMNIMLQNPDYETIKHLPVLQYTSSLMLPLGAYI